MDQPFWPFVVFLHISGLATDVTLFTKPIPSSSPKLSAMPSSYPTLESPPWSGVLATPVPSGALEKCSSTISFHGWRSLTGVSTVFPAFLHREAHTVTISHHDHILAPHRSWSPSLPRQGMEFPTRCCRHHRQELLGLARALLSPRRCPLPCHSPRMFP